MKRSERVRDQAECLKSITGDHPVHNRSIPVPRLIMAIASIVEMACLNGFPPQSADKEFAAGVVESIRRLASTWPQGDLDAVKLGMSKLIGLVEKMEERS